MSERDWNRKFGRPFRRHRLREDYESPQRLYRQTAFNGTVTDQWSNAYTTLRVGEFQATKDFVTPGYRTRIQRGEIVNHFFATKKVTMSHNYTGFKYQRNSGSGATIQYYESPHWYTVPVYFDWEPRPSSVPIESLKREAVTQALSKVNSSDIEGLVEIAEAHKIRDTLRIRTDALNKHLDYQLRKSKSLTAASIRALGGINKVMGSNWLRYRYGIMPMLYLMEDAISGDNPKSLRKTERGYANWTWSDSGTTQKSANYYTEDWDWDLNYEVSAHAGVLYRPDWRINRYGMSVRELPSAAYELTALSFVLDWFVNVGPWIRASVMTLGLKELARWVTVKEVYTKAVSLGTVTWNNYSGYSNVKSASGGHTVVVESTTRFVSPAAGLAVRRGSIQKILAGDKRLIDAWALAPVLLKRLMLTRP